VAVPGGGETPEIDGGSDILELICCVVASGAIGPDVLDRWAIDPERARKCLDRLCRRSREDI
jgi:hypothetical protein